MKNTKQFKFILFVIATVSLNFLVSCDEEDKPECCVGFGNIDTTYDSFAIVPNATETTNDDTIYLKGSLKFYSALTPRNYAFCDSLVKDDFLSTPGNPVYYPPYQVNRGANPELLCSPEEALEKYLDGCRSCCPCRKNPDTIYNDMGMGINYYFNDIFEIDGVLDFPNNRLIFRVPGDTSKVKVVENYDNKSSVFNGHITVDSTLYGRNPINKMMKSGKYEYEFIIFADEKKVVPFDTIKGYFCIIRTPEDDHDGCIGKEEGDPLLD